jgi:hypothetical protein
MWLLIVLVVVGVLAVLALVAGRRGTDDAAPGDADPLFTAGIAIAGASAALIVTLGFAMIPMLLIGLACVVIGAHRSRTRQP